MSKVIRNNYVSKRNCLKRHNRLSDVSLNSLGQQAPAPPSKAANQAGISPHKDNEKLVIELTPVSEVWALLRLFYRGRLITSFVDRNLCNDEKSLLQEAYEIIEYRNAINPFN
jgi:hypothetical protein